MFTKMELEIIRGVSTILFQEVEQKRRAYIREKDQEFDDLVHQKGYYFTVDDDKLDYEQKFCLFVRKIDNDEFIGIEKLYYDDYGELEDRKLLGYVKLGEQKRDRWDMCMYCQAIECIIEHGC